MSLSVDCDSILLFDRIFRYLHLTSEPRLGTTEQHAPFADCSTQRRYAQISSAKVQWRSSQIY